MYIPVGAPRAESTACSMKGRSAAQSTAGSNAAAARGPQSQKCAAGGIQASLFLRSWVVWNRHYRGKSLLALRHIQTPYLAFIASRKMFR
jgi:hypothetical protein